MTRRLAAILLCITLKLVALSLFQSRLMFGMPLVGGLWLPSKYLNREDIIILQTSQKYLMRIKLRSLYPL